MNYQPISLSAPEQEQGDMWKSAKICWDQDMSDQCNTFVWEGNRQLWTEVKLKVLPALTPGRFLPSLSSCFVSNLEEPGLKESLQQMHTKWVRMSKWKGVRPRVLWRSVLRSLQFSVFFNSFGDLWRICISNLKMTSSWGATTVNLLENKVRIHNDLGKLEIHSEKVECNSVGTRANYRTLAGIMDYRNTVQRKIN